jgi:GNAT superfamily N-acetyltransferase
MVCAWPPLYHLTRQVGSTRIIKPVGECARVIMSVRMAFTNLRRAAVADMPFLLEAIVAAEGGADGRPTTYENLLSLSRDALLAVIPKMLAAGGSGHPLALASFFILEDGQAPLATCAAWIEGEGGVASGFKVAMLLREFCGAARWVESKHRIRALSSGTPPRTPGTLQMETFFVVPTERGKGTTARLIAAVLDWHKHANVPFPGVEISLLEDNTSALKAYRRAGFRIQQECKSTGPVFREITGSDGFVQLRLDV